jgi:hypothetical protein
MIADSLHSSDPKARAALESAIKETTASRSQRAHGKGKDALNQLQPFWRLTVSLNDDGPGLSLLPRPDGSMSDKMLLFQVTRPDDMPTTDEEVKGNYIPALENGIPAFLYYLLHDHTIPEKLRTDRAGIIPYQNPDLVAELVGESQEALIVDKLYQFYFMGKTEEEKEKTVTLQSSAIFAALETRESMRRSLERLHLNEQNFGKVLTAIAERPLEGAYVGVRKRKSGKIVYDIFWKSDPSEPGA